MVLSMIDLCEYDLVVLLLNHILVDVYFYLNYRAFKVANLDILICRHILELGGRVTLLIISPAFVQQAICFVSQINKQ